MEGSRRQAVLRFCATRRNAKERPGSSGDAKRNASGYSRVLQVSIYSRFDSILFLVQVTQGKTS